VCEHLPRMARMADRYALVRSVHHKSAPIHETGHQLMQTGYLFRGGIDHPHYGAVLSHLRGRTAGGLPPFVVLPGEIGNTGVSVSHGQTAGYLGAKHEPLLVTGDATRGFHVAGQDAEAGVVPARHRTRRELVEAVDRVQSEFDAEASRASDAPAYHPLFAETAKKAFD